MSSHVEEVAETASGTPPMTQAAEQPVPHSPSTSRVAATRSERIACAIRTSSVPQRFLALLLVIFLFKGIIVSLVFPPYTGHDEVTHYAYLKIVAEEGRVPLIPDPVVFDREYSRNEEYDDWDMIPDEFYQYSEYVTSDWWSGYAEPVRAVTYQGMYLPSGWVYTGNHPPLFYLLLTPLFWLLADQTIETQLYVFRLLTIPFGMLTVLFAYLT
ncbi:MAG TPA: hypothetical protein VGR29_00310, partial [Thermomicrobiales bacterium]|nr:hypothetical protein [Thermomicrobiales bacterium]